MRTITIYVEIFLLGVLALCACHAPLAEPPPTATPNKPIQFIAFYSPI